MKLISKTVRDVDMHGKTGTHWIFQAPNGFGASVIDYGYSSFARPFELAVIHFTGEDNNYYLTYTTCITADVCGYLSWDEVEHLLKRINRLHRKPVDWSQMTHTLLKGDTTNV
jgi:hypothetical protein